MSAPGEQVIGRCFYSWQTLSVMASDLCCPVRELLGPHRPPCLVRVAPHVLWTQGAPCRHPLFASVLGSETHTLLSGASTQARQKPSGCEVPASQHGRSVNRAKCRYRRYLFIYLQCQSIESNFYSTGDSARLNRGYFWFHVDTVIRETQKKITAVLHKGDTFPTAVGHTLGPGGHEHGWSSGGPCHLPLPWLGVSPLLRGQSCSCALVALLLFLLLFLLPTSLPPACRASAPPQGPSLPPSLSLTSVPQLGFQLRAPLVPLDTLPAQWDAESQIPPWSSPGTGRQTVTNKISVAWRTLEGGKSQADCVWNRGTGQKGVTGLRVDSAVVGAVRPERNQCCGVADPGPS
ncbi:uncharacterized protein LOC110344653 [Heterocephalus glaber]|uniref:Uncharacterized protein LOC110344653 n=1 Tax=Heterocephalus glaber TaxID=10181 RepID=A0AAX6RG67_HETGA|nr:uncharacterized protein LOC110344653 [Heterocephalus glaber]